MCVCGEGGGRDNSVVFVHTCMKVGVFAHSDDKEMIGGTEVHV